MEFPPHPMEARSTKQAHGSKKQKPNSKTINLAVEKNSPGSSTNTCRSKKNIPTGSRKHTSKSPTFFVTLGPKKILVRSKKHVQVQKKGAQVQKTCIPTLNCKINYPKMYTPYLVLIVPCHLQSEQNRRMHKLPCHL